jgi:hypothetical protein
MYRFSITLEGVAPLLMHRLDPIKIIGPDGGKPKTTSAFEGNPGEWKSGCYWSEGAGLFVAADAIETAVKQGASAGRFKVMSKAARQYIESGMFLSPDEISVNLPKAASKDLARLCKAGPSARCFDTSNGNSAKANMPDFVDLRVIRLPSKGRQCRYRVIIPEGYKLTASGEMLHDEVRPELLQQLFSYAGTFKGLYEYRPKFGRFAVKSFETAE